MVSHRENEGKDEYPSLPHIDPDPKLQLDTWRLDVNRRADRLFNVQVRRAFVQTLIARHHLTSADEVREAVRRRFGAKPSLAITLTDLQEIGVVRVPLPGSGFRFKLASQLADANIEQELDERARLDLLGVNRIERFVYLEVNRGTAQALAQLLNLMVDDGAYPFVVAISTDQDKWVVVHTEDGNGARHLETTMRSKMM